MYILGGSCTILFSISMEKQSMISYMSMLEILEVRVAVSYERYISLIYLK